ncbi:MAG: aminotransferase class V-fold PLP-dependent enzyme [Sphingomonadales bacterium]|nr:aminotransferase class V-fold PLP-dependent enzyme [Sphingomonadales bacterium]
MSSRRKFIQQSALFVSGTLISATSNAWSTETNQISSHDDSLLSAMNDDDFWAWVRSCYTTSSNIINLNNGGVSPQPKQVQDTHIKYYQWCNEAPTYYMWRSLDEGREPLRRKLAKFCGTDPDEISINRNATEALNTIIFGLDLKAGDEIVMGKYDYPNMRNAWRQREKRDKIQLKMVELNMPTTDDDYIFQTYAAAITPRTKIVHLTHLINWTGQIIPVHVIRKIADLAHQMGAEVIVDGAHTFAHTVYQIPDLGCDYYGTSLHKWMCAPFGNGMLYIKKDKIQKIWALLSSDQPDSNNIRKFETLGTRSFAAEMAIGTAIDFHDLIGSERKEKRLFFLKKYWTDQVKNLPGVIFYSPLEKNYSCGIANIGIKGMKGTEIEGALFKNRKVHTVAIEYEKVNGVRVTPNVYTSLNDLDELVAGIKELLL